VLRVRCSEALRLGWAATVRFLAGWQTVIDGGAVSRILVALAALALGLAVGNLGSGIVLGRIGRRDFLGVAVNVAAF
jgi:hypothetical protein